MYNQLIFSYLMYSVEVIPNQRTGRLPSTTDSMDSIHPSNFSVSVLTMPLLAQAAILSSHKHTDILCCVCMCMYVYSLVMKCYKDAK